jgi:hypothetical protein
VSRLQQFFILLQRSFEDGLKDRKKFVAGMLLKLTIGLIVGICWLDQAGDTQDSIFPTQGAIFVCIFSSVMDTMLPMVMQVRNASYAVAEALTSVSVPLGEDANSQRISQWNILTPKSVLRAPDHKHCVQLVFRDLFGNSRLLPGWLED